MDTINFTNLAILFVFIIGYVFITCEHFFRINKACAALFVAVVCWTLYFVGGSYPLDENLRILGHHLADVSQIIFFLIGAMAIVEIVDAHKGFQIITDFINTHSKRKLLWIIGILTFFMSAVLDNLTSTIVVVSLLRKLIPDRSERVLFGCMAVIAANAGGAWTPIGDVTTTMLWINGQISSFSIMRALFIPSLASLGVALSYQSLKLRRHPSSKIQKGIVELDVLEPKGRMIFYVGLLALTFVPILKALTGLPPFMGMLIGLSALWIITDLLHHNKPGRDHLRMPHILTKIDTTGILFFLGILLSVKSLESAGLLKSAAIWLDAHMSNAEALATFIGLLSAIIDNVPLVAACMGMYDLHLYPIDCKLWEMIAYCAGTGGSILIIGSAAGVALMGMEKVDFFWYFKKISLTAFLAYIAGFIAYLLIHMI